MVRLELLRIVNVVIDIDNMKYAVYANYVSHCRRQQCVDAKHNLDRTHRIKSHSVAAS